MHRLVDGRGGLVVCARLCRAAPPRGQLAAVSTAGLALALLPAMSIVARFVVMIVLGMIAASCGVAVAGGASDEADEVQVVGTSERVLGKRAFDAAHSGYAPFEPLVGEAPRRTLARAADRIDELERDLATMQRHHDPAEDVGEALARAHTLLDEARVALGAAEDADVLDDARLAPVVALIGEAQEVLHGARQARVLAAA